MKKALPDSDTVNSVLQRIADEKKWSSQDTEQDLAVLAKHRLVYVGDLRALSGESWTQIELLPLVKDLLRSSIDPHWPPRDHIVNTNNSANNIDQIMENSDDEENNNKQKKKEGKKQKKGKKKQGKKDKGFKSPSPLGTPVVPTILTRPSNAIQELNDSTSRFNLNDTLSQDHITIQNTIRNGNATNSSSDITSTDDFDSDNSDDSDSDLEKEDADELLSPNSEEKRKSVSFSNETAVGIAASVKNELDKEDKKEKKGKKKDKKKDKKDKKKDSMASTKYSGYQSFTSHPYTTHPIVKFRKMKMKHCKRLPPVPANDQFLQGIRDKLESTV